MDQPLWQPTSKQIAQANLTAFMHYVEKYYKVKIKNYAALYEWSISSPEQFWDGIWLFCDVLGKKEGPALINKDNMLEAQFYPKSTLNYAENLLRPRPETQEVLIFRSENAKIQRRVTYGALCREVAQLAQALKKIGVRKGDRVAAIMPNIPETVTAMLAVTALGAVWSSCSPDFGVDGILDRFQQISPKVLISVNGYYYNGKHFNISTKLAAVAQGLKKITKVIVTSYDGKQPQVTSHVPGSITWQNFIKPERGAPLKFRPVAFNDPVYILFSSGTTGKPKCIVHGVGGTLLQHYKEHQFHSDIKQGDRVFYFTTCGWMMWNWLVSALSSNATLLLFDGSPFHPDPHTLLKYIDEERATFFGVSAKFIDAVMKSGINPSQHYNFGSLRTIASTGSPLSPDNFKFIYTSIKDDVCLASISGGTDIIGCFALGNPIGPVWPGELQTRALGLNVQVYNKKGQPVRREKGELVCTAPFPSQPIGFWQDPQKKRYRQSYFNKFSKVWCHGDFVELTKHDGLIIYGRSDATLNPGGVRIGTAEIYRQLDDFPGIAESVVVGQNWQDDVRVILCVKMKSGASLDEKMIESIKKKIRHNTSPRHVPAKIIAVPDIPRTLSGKIVEMAVRQVIEGQEIDNKNALANPKSLDYFKNLPDLKF